MPSSILTRNVAWRMIAGVHGCAFGRARFVDDALEEAADRGIGQRSGIGALGVLQDFALAVGLIKRKILRLLELADFERAAGALVEKLDEFAVDVIDALPPITEQAHSATSRRDRPWRAASFSERMRAASAVAAPSTDFAFSISLTNAEPITAASARPPSTETWPGKEMPKPTAMGSVVMARAPRSRAGSSSGSESFAPVTPVREIK